MNSKLSYHEGMRQLQDARDTRRLADRIAEVSARSTFTENDRSLIQRSAMFFIATADLDGHPECSYKGGFPGFVRVVDEHTLAFPDYDGNGMYRSWGNVVINPNVGLLFIDFENPRRVRVNGTAHVHASDPLLAEYPDAVFIIRVSAKEIFSNCPRYVHRMQRLESSPYTPRVDYAPPVPDWKKSALLSDWLPARDRIPPEDK